MVEVHPPRLELTQVEEGIKYVLAVAVRNTSVRRCRVRIVPPCSATLRLSSASDVDLAPGLELRAELAEPPVARLRVGQPQRRPRVHSDAMVLDASVLARSIVHAGSASAWAPVPPASVSWR